MGVDLEAMPPEAGQSVIMQCYEEIAPLTERMLAFARAGNWDDVVMLEAQFRAIVERLKTIEPIEAQEQSHLSKKYRLLREILAGDAEIRNLIAPELARLSVLMGSMQRQKNLHQAYGK